MRQASNHVRFAGIADDLTDHIGGRLRRIDQVLRASATMLVGSDARHPARFASWASRFDTAADFRGLGPIRFARKNQQELSAELLGDGASPPLIQSDMVGAGDSTFLVSAGENAAGSRHVALAPVRSGDAQSLPTGFVYAPVDIEAFMASELAREAHAGLRIRLYDGPDPVEAPLVYDSDRGSAGPALTSSYREDHHIDMFGSPWSISIEAAPNWGLAEAFNPVPTMVAAGTLLTLLILRAATARTPAQATAHGRKARYDTPFIDMPIATWICNRETMTVLAVNEAAIVPCGYTGGDFLHATWSAFAPLRTRTYTTCRKPRTGRTVPPSVARTPAPTATLPIHVSAMPFARANASPLLKSRGSATSNS